MNFFFHAEVVNFTWGNNYGLTGQMGFGHKGLVSFEGLLGGDLQPYYHMT